MRPIGPRSALPILLLLAAAAPPGAPELQRAQQAQAADLAAQQAATARFLLAEQQAQRLAAARVVAAARLLVTESALAEAGQRVAELARRRDAAEAQLATDSRALAPLLPVIERLSMFPAETLLALPGSPEDAVRGVLVVGGLARQLRARAAQVVARRESLRALQAQLDAALPALRAAALAQRAQAASLDAALAQARGTDTAEQLLAERAARRAATDAARADTLRQAIAMLDAAHGAAARRRAARLAQAAGIAAPPATLAAAAIPSVLGSSLPGGEGQGGWIVPAAGRIVQNFGAPGDEGLASGITYQTPPGARVVSPCAGRVEFAAPFRSYGLLVILDCGGGGEGGDVHVVLSGLQRLDAASGEAVQAGEPVGIMSPSTNGGLYLEVRRGDAAVDPAPYLRPAS